MRRMELRDGAYLELDEHWIEAADARAFEAVLTRELPWQARAIRLFGREVMQPRLVAWVGDPSAVYSYSGVRLQPSPWTPSLTALRAQLAERCGLSFNSVLCNLYRDGKDSMGLHSDSEPELGPEPVLASLSFGTTRRFQLRHRDTASPKLDLELASGSLLVMRGTTQRFYRHAVPKQPSITTPRINLTFRRIIG